LRDVRLTCCILAQFGDKGFVAIRKSGLRVRTGRDRLAYFDVARDNGPIHGHNDMSMVMAGLGISKRLLELSDYLLVELRLHFRLLKGLA
jgi:hypothetical protein